MMNMETRHGEQKPVIKKALVDLEGKAFKYFVDNRAAWSKIDSFVYPGPIQYFGDKDIIDSVPKILGFKT